MKLSKNKFNEREGYLKKAKRTREGGEVHKVTVSGYDQST